MTITRGIATALFAGLARYSRHGMGRYLVQWALHIHRHQFGGQRAHRDLECRAVW